MTGRIPFYTLMQVCLAASCHVFLACILVDPGSANIEAEICEFFDYFKNKTEAEILKRI